MKQGAGWLATIALCVGGCTTIHATPRDRALDILVRLKTAHLGDALFAENLPETLNQELGARSLLITRSGDYTHAVLTSIPGLERSGAGGHADVTVERWDTPEGPAVKVVLRQNGMGPTGSQVSALFQDYVYERRHGNHLRFPVSFHCSSQNTEREVQIGVSTLFEIPEEYHFISRRLPYAVANVPSRTGEVLVRASAPWTLSPEAPAPAYPDRALLLERESTVRLTCQVAPSGRLQACTVQSEYPPGFQFAANALSWSESAILHADGESTVDAADAVNIDVVFRLGWTEEPCPAVRDAISGEKGRGPALQGSAGEQAAPASVART